MDINPLILDSDTDDEYLEDLIQNARKAKIIRPRTDHFQEWDESEFFMRFRITKLTALNLLDEINDKLEYTTDR